MCAMAGMTDFSYSYIVSPGKCYTAGIAKPDEIAGSCLAYRIYVNSWVFNRLVIMARFHLAK